MIFKIYAGLGGGFGGPNEQGEFEFASVEEAEDYARQCAIEEYESYEGCHGIMDREECREDYIDSFGKEPSEETLEDFYNEQIESWISWYVKEV